MTYITVKQPPMYHQMTLEELLFGTNPGNSLICSNVSNTKTYEVTHVSNKFRERVDIPQLVQKLHDFNVQTEALRETPRHDLYREFDIPKKSNPRKKRHISAPEPALKNALYMLKTIFEYDFGALYHTSAFAYIEKRSTVDCMKRHQANESKWFAKYDLSNFFGSTTPEFVTKMFSMVFPFSEVLNCQDGKREFEKAIDLAFLDGGLPQGTPVSPIITNVMMIPIDFKLANGFRDFEKQRFVYTRYADDFQISSKYDFDFKDVERFISDTLEEFEAPFKINKDKTRYGSSAGSNWNLGLMLNKDNKITVGHKKKKQFQAMLAAYVMDKRHGVEWDKSEIQSLDGNLNYYRMVEGETIDKIVAHVGNKFGVDIAHMIREDLRL